MLRVFATFLKKGSAKNFPTGKVLGYFSKIVRSTVVVNRRAFLLNYAIGVYGLKFNITNIEFGCRHCRLGVCGNNFNITNTKFSVFGKNSVTFLKKQLKKFRFWKNILKIY